MIKNNICMKKKERNQLQPSMCNHPWSCLTCPQEEHFIAPINSIHLIHHQGSVPIVHTSSHHQGAAMDRINWMKHEGMGSDEIHSLIWKVLWGSDTRSEGSSWTLGGKKRRGDFVCIIWWLPFDLNFSIWVLFHCVILDITWQKPTVPGLG